VRLLFLWIPGLLLSLPLQAGDPLPMVQRELRARKFYFGEIHGRANDETVAAIVKFKEARGIDNTTGNLDDETLRALGLPGPSGNREQGRALEECCTRVRQYLQVWQSGDWEREVPFFAAEVNYYDDQNVNRAFIREARIRENQRWPRRKSTLLQRIASQLPGRGEAAQVTARVRTEVARSSGPARVLTEDLIFRLEKTDGDWRIVALKLLE